MKGVLGGVLALGVLGAIAGSAAAADALSGGDPKSGSIATSNALYPNLAYSIEAPANLIQPGLVATAAPRRTSPCSTPSKGSGGIPPATPSTPPRSSRWCPTASDDTFSGAEQQLEASWRLNAFVTLKAAYVHFFAGAFVRRGGGRDENFGMTSISLRL